MKTIIFCLSLFISPLVFAEDWGKTGHRVVAEIASNYLTDKTKMAIGKILDGQRLAYISTYADEIKSDQSFKKYNPWHYVNLPLNQAYNPTKPSENGDVLTAINYFIDQLKDETTTREDSVFALKFLVHLIGDIHQPCHVGQEEDKGGNLYYLKWFGRKTNLHRVWDSEMIAFYGMSYTELSDNLRSIYAVSADHERIINTRPIDWLNESQNELKAIYQQTEEGANLRYEYHYKNFPLVEKKLYYAGVRLAAVLNEIFDS
mgnify:CR=1 FL=1